MREFKNNLGKVLLVLIFALTFIATPVYAEEDTIEEPGTSAGDEWDGNIKDPEPTPTPEPTPVPQPAPQPTPEPVSQPAPRPANSTKTTPVATPAAETPAETAATEVVATEPTAEEAPAETSAEETPAEETLAEKTPTEAPEVPVVSTPESEDSIKRRVIVLASVIGVILTAILVRATAGLVQNQKSKKIYKDALKKSHEVKKANITRAG